MRVKKCYPVDPELSILASYFVVYAAFALSIVVYALIRPAILAFYESRFPFVLAHAINLAVGAFLVLAVMILAWLLMLHIVILLINFTSRYAAVGDDGVRLLGMAAAIRVYGPPRFLKSSPNKKLAIIVEIAGCVLIALPAAIILDDKAGMMIGVFGGVTVGILWILLVRIILRRPIVKLPESL